MIKENKITSLSKILLISTIVILLLGGTLIYYYSTTITKIIETTTVTETKTTTTTVFLDADGDGIPNYKEKEYGTDPNKPNYLLAYALKKLPENEALKFKNVENFNESSKGLVDLYSSLPENIRNSKGVDELLNQILSDNIINELEKNLFYDKFVLPSLPLIFNLEWSPTRVILDKIYDINVTFIAKDDDTPIAYAELHFVPVEYHYMIEKYGMRQEDYPKVFPPDKERVYVLTPIDGKFDSLEERFAITIADIVGGREYKIVALIRDLAGNERKTEIKTPYIRQFENLGKELYERGIIISAAYMPWNFKDIRMEVDKPLLGRYDASDDLVQWKHVDWATGHGINAFFIDGGFWEKYKLEGREGAIINGFMNKGIKCAIMWGWVWEKYFKRGSNDTKLASWVVDLNDNYNLEMFKNLMKSLLDNKIFLHPNYLRIEGRPVLFIYDEIALINERNAYLYLLDEFKKTINQTPFLIADTLFRIPGKPYNEYESYHYQFKDFQYKDGLTSWIGFYNPVPFYREYMENYDELLPTYLETWSSFTKEKGKYFIPSILPSFIVSGEANSLSRDIKKFEIRLGNCIKFLDKRKPILMVDTWNDWLETTSVEPSQGEQFTYLTILKSQLKQLI